MRLRASKSYNFIGIHKLLISLGFVAFLVINIFGLSLSVSKQFHLNTLKCSTGQQQNSCKNIAQHASNWQSAFVATESESVSFFLLLVLGLVFYFIKNTGFSFHWKDINGVDSVIGKLRKRFRNFLQLAFSRGILQPTR